VSPSVSGQWKKIISQDCPGCWSVYKAHFPVHIWICAGGCNAAGGPKDKKDEELFFSTGLSKIDIQLVFFRHLERLKISDLIS
jgi:hypothetical protein